MKKFLSSRIFWGTVLIIVGILVLLDSLDILNINDLLLLIVVWFCCSILPRIVYHQERPMVVVGPRDIFSRDSCRGNGKLAVS